MPGVLVAMELCKLKDALQSACRWLKGAERRMFMAKTVHALGPGGGRLAERELGWNRETLRKALSELLSGADVPVVRRPHPHARIFLRLPHLKRHLREIVDPKTHAEPRKRNTRLYCPHSVSQITDALIREKHYRCSQLPSQESLRQIINAMGYTLRRVQKSKPLKRVPLADEIFDNVHRLNREADSSDTDAILRISLDTKARVNMGEFDRGGRARVLRKALDHDFPGDVVVPMGLFVPKYDEVYIDLCQQRATADSYVDSLECFWQHEGHRFPRTTTLQLNLDCGPDNNSRRTQFMARLVQFADQTGLRIVLAYYPPYQSKYNPIERCWSVLENLWRGELLDSLEAVFQYASKMTYNGVGAVVQISDKAYQTGISLSKAAMGAIEKRLHRSETLPKYHVTIEPARLPAG